MCKFSNTYTHEIFDENSLEFPTPESSSEDSLGYDGEERKESFELFNNKNSLHLIVDQFNLFDNINNDYSFTKSSSPISPLPEFPGNILYIYIYIYII